MAWLIPKKSPWWRKRDESLGAVYPPPRRHVSLDGRRGARRHPGLQLLAGVLAAGRRFPNDLGPGHTSGREPRDNGILGGHAARATVRPNRRHHRDEFHQLSRLDRYQHSV